MLNYIFCRNFDGFRCKTLRGSQKYKLNFSIFIMSWDISILGIKGANLLFYLFNFFEKCWTIYFAEILTDLDVKRYEDLKNIS